MVAAVEEVDDEMLDGQKLIAVPIGHVRLKGIIPDYQVEVEIVHGVKTAWTSITLSPCDSFSLCCNAQTASEQGVTAMPYVESPSQHSSSAGSPRKLLYAARGQDRRLPGACDGHESDPPCTLHKQRSISA